MFWSQEEPLAQFAKKPVQSLTEPCQGGLHLGWKSGTGLVLQEQIKLRFQEAPGVVYACLMSGAALSIRVDGNGTRGLFCSLWT